MATILVLRHGETAWNDNGRLQGWAPVPLNDRGHEQAAAVAEAIATEYDVDRIVTSDLRRTVETARPVARATGAPIERDSAWRERDFGALQGLDYREAFGGYPEFSIYESGHWAVDAVPDGGESWLGMRERAQAAFDGLVEELDESDTVLVVTHGGPTHAVLETIEGVDAVESLDRYEVGNCAGVEIAVDNGHCSVVRGPELFITTESEV